MSERAHDREIESIQIRTPSRLHFGLLRAAGEGRLFGGAGAMIDSPAIDLRLDASEAFAVAGTLAPRVRRFAEAWAAHYSLVKFPACRIEIVEAPREHIGLGLGTQLGLAVAAALSLAHFRNLPPIEELASSVQRGARSAVGAHGFARGGLILDAGKGACAGGALAPLEERIELPASWRFVLLCPQGQRGLSGGDERQAFADLPPIPEATVDQLAALLYEQLAPSARAADFDRLSTALFEYGRLAGSCFASRQAGAWSSDDVAQIVAEVRAWGVAGVGQSSWGPTVFALVGDEAAAARLARQAAERWGEAVEITIAAPNNTGASIHATSGGISQKVSF